MKKKYKFINKPLPRKPKKIKLTVTQKVAFSMLTAVVAIYSIPEAVVKIYNYINRGDTTPIKLPQKEDLFPGDDKGNDDDRNQEKIKNENNNYAYNFLRSTLRPQIEEKLGFAIEGEFDVLSVFELNLRSDAFSSKNTQLRILLRAQNGNMFCVVYNNNYAQTEIEKEGFEFDAVSSLIAHIQGSSLQAIEITPDLFEGELGKEGEDGIVFVGETQTYYEKNGEKSFCIPVFLRQDGEIVCRTFKGLQNDIEKVDKNPEQELFNLLQGKESLMTEYQNKKQQDLSHLNNVLEKIGATKYDEKQDNPVIDDMFPEDFFDDFDQDFSKD